jgi:SAM-dependent methyltransferase
MNALKALKRRRWFLVFLLAAGLAWWLAFDYLIDFRAPDVPFVVTPADVVEKMLDLAEAKPTDYLVDLGSGDGRVLIAAGRRGIRSKGIELDDLLVDKSRVLIEEAGFKDKARVVRGDIFRENFADATVVTMFLKIDLNVRLRPQFDKLKPGTRIVSHMWSMPGAKPVKTIDVKSQDDGLDHRVHLWVTPIQWETPAGK